MLIGEHYIVHFYVQLDNDPERKSEIPEKRGRATVCIATFVYNAVEPHRSVWRPVSQ